MKWSRIAVAVALGLALQMPALAQSATPSPVNVWKTIAATGTQTSNALSVPSYSMTGTLIVTWASITGSPLTCTLQVKSADTAGNFINNGAAISVTPANGTSSLAFNPSPNLQNAPQLEAVFVCGTYPTAGTLTLDFVPALAPLDEGPAGAANYTAPGCTAAAMTGTTSTVTIAAPSSPLHNYVSALTITNSHATVGTFVVVQDGSSGTTLWEGYAAAAGGGFTISFPNGGLRQPTAATGLYVADVTTGANVIACATGYTGP